MGFIVYLLISCLSATIGYVMGDDKDCGLEGAAWGFFLGLLGLLIVAVRKPSSRVQA